MSESTQTGARIFVSYAHEDRALKEELDKHLKVLKRSFRVQVWSDREIPIGQEWDAAITSELHTADIILLLVSVDFNASDFIWEKELSVAMRRHEQGSAVVVPIILRRCDWDEMPYAKLQALPPQGAPLSEYSDPDTGYTEIAQAISELVDRLNTRAGATR